MNIPVPRLNKNKKKKSYSIYTEIYINFYFKNKNKILKLTSYPMLPSLYTTKL